MKSHDHEMSIGVSGDGIALLHKGLILLGYKISDSEVKKELFGKSTRDAVRNFQSDHHLQVTGNVNESTNNLLHNLTVNKDIISNEDPNATRKKDIDNNNKQDKNVSEISLITNRNASVLLKPDVLFGNLKDLRELDNDGSSFIAKKLNDQFHTEVLEQMGEVSDTMREALKKYVDRLDFRQLKRSGFPSIIRNVLLEVKKHGDLRNEVSEIENRLANRSLKNVTISDLLHLDSPLNENPFFYRDILRAKAIEYASIAQLSDLSMKKLADKNIDLEKMDEASMNQLVKERIVNDKQKHDLKLIIALGRLTRSNLSFIRALKSEELKSTADLVSWKKSDWKQLITEEKIPLPPGENIESYAETILSNIERTYPSQVLLTDLLNPNLASHLTILDSLNTLIRNNDKLIDNNTIKPNVDIDWRGIGAQRRGRLQKDLQNIAAFVNTYKHLGIANILNDKELDIDQKKNAVASRINLLHTFYGNNPNLDLRFVNFFDIKSSKINWKNIPAANQPVVRKQMMAYQRTLNMAKDPPTAQILLSKGYDSCMSVVEKTEEEFSRTSGLDPKTAAMTYDTAQEQSMIVAHNCEVIRDTVDGEFKDIAMSNLSPEIANYLQGIDGYSDLFGCQNFCGCEECKSVLGPAAYFVDLMSFIEKNVSNPVFVSTALEGHPIYLKNRRPDLWKLPLTCENTNTLIPYLTIVNEVLTEYLSSIVTGDIFYEMSKGSAKTSFDLPFNLPLLELRTFLKHFGISLYDIYKKSGESDYRIWRAKINLSQDEFNVIRKPDIPGIEVRFGSRPSLTNFDLEEFLQIVHLTRQQLVDLLAISFRADLKDITIAPTISDELTDPDVEPKCEEVLNNLTYTKLDFIHRFIQLWKKTAWSIKELDLVLKSLAGAGIIEPTDLDRRAVQYVSLLIEMQENLGLTVEELCTMFYHFPVSDSFPKSPPKLIDKKMFERIFDIEKLFVVEGARKFQFHHYAFNELNKDDKEIDPITPVLLGGLGISEPELQLLLELLNNQEVFDSEGSYKITFNSAGNCELDLKKISLLYRHARLSRALNIPVGQFIGLINLKYNSTNFAISDIEQIRELVKTAKWIRESPFNIYELEFILKGKENDVSKYKTNEEAVKKMVREIQKPPNNSDKLKLSALKTELTKSFNLTINQLTDISRWLNTDVNSIKILSALNTDFTNPDDLTSLIDLFKEMERITLVFDKLELNKETISNLTNKPEILGIADIKNLTLDDIEALTIFKKFIKENDEEKNLSLSNVLASYNKSIGFSSSDKKILADLWKRDQSMIDSLLKMIKGFSRPVKALECLWDCVDVCNILGINGSSLRKLVDYSDVEIVKHSDFAKLVSAKDIVFGAFSSKYHDEKIRNNNLEPYLDDINTKKRDALCDYIIALKKELKFKNLHDIYSFFLLDVEMSGCFRTSRLVCAISSLQLYVHRCLVNLERSSPDSGVALVHVKPDRIPQDQWDWRANYRVWEANRKVFLYPENYIEPDLRDNKTPLFKELEDELLQQKITKESAELAYKKYVSQFAELARMKIAGSYHHEVELDDVGYETYYFFGCTSEDPPQYYYRKWIHNKKNHNKVWTPWVKMELAINSDRISAIVYLGKLYVFWLENKITEKKMFTDGTSGRTVYTTIKELKYSFLNEQGRWISPQKLLFVKDLWHRQPSPNNIVFPDIRDNQIHVFGYDWQIQSNRSVNYRIDLFRNRAVNLDIPPHTNAISTSEKRVSDYFDGTIKIDSGLSDEAEADLAFAAAYLYPNVEIQNYVAANYGKIPAKSELLKLNIDYSSSIGNLVTFVSAWQAHEPRYETEIVATRSSSSLGSTSLTSNFNITAFQPELHIVGNRPGDYIFKLGNQQYLIKKYHPLSPFDEGGWADSKRASIRLSTSLTDKLGEILFTKELESFLSLETQMMTEDPIGIIFTKMTELQGPYDDPNHIDLEGSYGDYYKELFFQIPWLIASSLNANQKFKEAKWWYERIFNPTASDSPASGKPKDRSWRYIEFRNLTIKKIKDILTNGTALEQYRKDPFNPHAIARLRTSAYQKAIVMKYIDNLLDWGDYLFSQDTMESINEATMLYVLAADILGKRPARVGTCKTAKEEDLTYDKISPAIHSESDFLIMLENWSQTNVVASAVGKMELTQILNSTLSVAANNNSSTITVTEVEGTPHEDSESASDTIFDNYKPNYNISEYDDVRKQKENEHKNVKRHKSSGYHKTSPEQSLTKQSTLVFCVPPNDVLLKYWDRVEDRLFKIHNCMNISGKRRQLALFQPPIDPMMLVRARAAGLTLEDILAGPEPEISSYRFSYLIEKAKQFTQSVHSFGSELLAALEKKDVEELTLKRSKHERNILRMTRGIKEQQINEAQKQFYAMEETKINVQNRIDYYQGLITVDLIGWEQMQQISRHIATGFKMVEGGLHLLAGIYYLIPNAGSPFAMTYGGKQLGTSGAEFAQWTGSMAAVFDAVSASAGLEASFQRRKEEWNHQLTLASQELKQVEQQRLAADIRQQIAQKDLDIHLQNIEHTDELDRFYKDKFTSLGLYNYLCTTLNRLYREAYNLAKNMAVLAEKAYQYETDDGTFFIQEDNWQPERAGLLAGEHLLLQLQQMEEAYIKKHTRDHEVTQSFSLALIDPSALMNIRQTGKTDDRFPIHIPEIMFDILYPGQYKRLIKSVRISIPSVTGPYSNVAAVLTLEESKVRKTTTSDLEPRSYTGQTSIATSNAQNDTGMFDFNFRDERYLPFEGAGAISTWQLELPSKIRSFDYDTISDVIFHISYTAKYDAGLKTKVEDNIATLLSAYASPTGGGGLYRLISLKHEFPDKFYQLLNPVSGTKQSTQFELGQKHFPYFLADKRLNLLSVTVYLQPKGMNEMDAINTEGLALKLNKSPVGGWIKFGKNLQVSKVSLTGNPIRKDWTIDEETKGLDKEKLDDILILLRYTAA